jgi:hypothetical protein
MENGEQTIDAPGLIVLVPRSTIRLPNGVLVPFLSVLVEAVGDILLRNPRFDVVALHLFDDLNSIFGDFEEWASYGTVLYRPGVVVQ